MVTMLAIFDIDGTLTETNAVDEECYCVALGDALGVAAADVMWAGAPHVTDSGIAHWLWQKHTGGAPTAVELRRVRRRFVELLNDMIEVAPHRFAAVPGAGTIVSRLHDHGWAVAFATGGWSEAARLKLNAAGVSHADVPLASGDDGTTREEIVQLALARAEAVTGRAFRRVISVGDGLWDARTARALQLPFVGIATGQHAVRLKAAGARTVLEHLKGSSDVIEVFCKAEVPS